jgi:hypothetical protein
MRSVKANTLIDVDTVVERMLAAQRRVKDAEVVCEASLLLSLCLCFLCHPVLSFDGQQHRAGDCVDGYEMLRGIVGRETHQTVANDQMNARTTTLVAQVAGQSAHTTHTANDGRANDPQREESQWGLRVV